MYNGGTEFLRHPLDVVDRYVHDWIEYLSNPDEKSVDYTGPRCPFAKKVRDDNRLKLVRVYDYFSAYDYWEVVSRECELFDGSKDVVIVAAKSDANIINPDQMSGGVDGLNTFLNTQGKDLWLVHKIEPSFTIIMIQKISALDDSSDLLKEKGYYTTRYSEAQIEKVVNGRKRYREKLNEKS